MILNIGFILFSIFIGFMLGASNSPVVGGFLTAILGLVGAIIGTEFLSGNSAKLHIDKRVVGASLSLSAIFMFAGLMAG